MKLKSLCSVALLAAISTSLVGGSVAHADEKTVKGTGDVTFVEDTDDNDLEDPEKDKNVDDKNDDIVKPEPGQKGPIMIDAVAKLHFGAQKITASKDAQNYYAAPIEVNEPGSTTKEKRGPWLQWTDKRAGNDHTYNITAKMTKQFTAAKSATNTLAGATITYASPYLKSNTAAADNFPAADKIKNTFELDHPDAATAKKVTVVDNSAKDAAKPNKGLGTYTLEFGQSDEFIAANPGGNYISAEGTETAVKLTVPGGQSIVQDTYTAEITWAVEYTPAP